MQCKASFLEFIFPYSFYTFKKMNFSLFSVPQLHLKMNFYCIENHKYGNSILDFTLKLLKYPRIALLMHSVTLLAPKSCCPFVLFCLQAARRARGRTNFKDLLPLKRIFFSRVSRSCLFFFRELS